MYSDNVKKNKTWIIWLLLAIIVFAAALIFFKPGRDLSEEGAAAIRDAVERSARQCYVVEGIYPPDLRYLQDNYGLQINTDDYYVTYDAFASNLPPTVIVRAK